jgi:hypothetical protein
LENFRSTSEIVDCAWPAFWIVAVTPKTSPRVTSDFEDVSPVRRRDGFVCTLTVIADTLTKMEICSPSAETQNFPPGSSEADHVAAGNKDIPTGVNRQWNLDFLRAYVGRAARALDRERFIVPLRYARCRWDAYLEAIRNPTADDKSLQAAGEAWEAAAAGMKDNCSRIEGELSRKDRRPPAESLMAEWASRCAEVADAMQTFAVARRAARAGSGEERSEMDAVKVKEVERRFEALDSNLRTMPGL